MADHRIEAYYASQEVTKGLHEYIQAAYTYSRTRLETDRKAKDRAYKRFWAAHVKYKHHVRYAREWKMF